MNMKEMMKNKTLLLASIAAALLSACGSDEDLDAVDQEAMERGVVKTEFSLSVPMISSNKTRMSEAITQSQTSAVFRGMTGISLLSFTNEPGNGGTYGTTITLPKFGEETATNTINSFEYANINARLYKDVAIPVGTNWFLFYGVAAPGNDPKETTGALDVDGLTAVGTNGVDGISFSPVPIWNDKKGNDTDINTNAVAVELDKYINKLVGITVWKDAKSVVWANAYHKMLSLIAGSSANIQAMVQEIYGQLHAKASSDTEANTIKTAILALKKDDDTTPYATDSNDEGTLTFDASISGYPANIGLPDGVVYVKYKDHDTSDSDPTETFKHVTPTTKDDAQGLNNVTGEINNMGAATSYIYPASLYYTAISPIKTSTSSKEDEYTSVNGGTDPSWTNVLAKYDEGDGSVQWNTRSIAIKNQIQYAVARLDTKFYADLGGNLGLKDSENKDVAIEANNFKLTAVIVGGQKAVDYKFEPTTETTAPEYTVYDNQPDANKYLGTSNASLPVVCRTLLLETAGGTSTDHEKVKVAIELENCTDKSFAGINGNRVYPHTKFYLIGTLEADDDHAKVFEQDHYTTATFKITSLKKAYNVLPDLRAPQLELGLSVNLEWQAGLDATIIIE